MCLTIHTYDSNHSIYIYVDSQQNAWYSLNEIIPILGYIDDSFQKHLYSAHKCSWKDLKGDGILNNSTMFVNESGLFQLMFRTNKYEAIAFGNWITETIIPILREQSKQSMEHLISEYSNWIHRQLPFEEPSSGYLFVATSDLYKLQGKYLIGCTINLNMRLKSLNHGRAADDQLYYVISKFFNDRRLAEMDVHTALDVYRQTKDVFIVPNFNIILDAVNK